MSDAKCVVCEHTENKVPLITVKYQDQEYHICPSHLPMLIHQPHLLVGKMPGAENLTPHEH